MSGKQVQAVDVHLASCVKQVKLSFCRRLTTANSLQQYFTSKQMLSYSPHKTCTIYLKSWPDLNLIRPCYVKRWGPHKKISDINALKLTLK